jgi:UTP-glucose-1-phosphate uridylyltransferase
MQVRQGLAKGLGHAVLCAHPVVGDEPVAVILLHFFPASLRVRSWYRNGFQ